MCCLLKDKSAQTRNRQQKQNEQRVAKNVSALSPSRSPLPQSWAKTRNERRKSDERQAAAGEGGVKETEGEDEEEEEEEPTHDGSGISVCP